MTRSKVTIFQRLHLSSIQLPVITNHICFCTFLAFVIRLCSLPAVESFSVSPIPKYHICPVWEFALISTLFFQNCLKSRRKKKKTSNKFQTGFFTQRTCVSGCLWGDSRRAYLHLCLCDKHSSTVLMHQLFTFMTASTSLKYLLSIRP